MEKFTMESAISNAAKKCCEPFMNKLQYQMSNNVYSQVFSPQDILLDIYCDKTAFHIIDQNRLHEALDEFYYSHRYSCSSITIKNNLDSLKNDLKTITNFQNTYAGEFLRGIMTSADERYSTFSDALLCVIIWQWRNMPFNPRYLTPNNLSDLSLSLDKIKFFLSLNNMVNETSKSERLVFNHLIDHFFNINTFCQFVNYTQYIAVEKDYALKPSPIMPYFTVLMAALQSLPTWRAKNYFWQLFIENATPIIADYKAEYFKMKNENEPCKEKNKYIYLLEQIIKDALYFSQVHYPLIKCLFSELLYSELSPYNFDEDEIFSGMKLILDGDIDHSVEFYPQFQKDIYATLKLMPSKELDHITKDFYSIKSMHPIVPEKYSAELIDQYNADFAKTGKKIHELISKNCSI